MNDNTIKRPEFGERIDFDPMLEGMVRSTEDGSITGLEVTLIAGGQAVTGTMVSFAEYLRGQGKGETIETRIQESQELRATLPDTPYQTIHLRGAQVVMSGVAFPVGWWRGRLSMIAGFNFKTATVTDDPDSAGDS